MAEPLASFLSLAALVNGKQPHLPRAALPALVTDQAAGEGLAAGLATNELSADVLSNERTCVAMVKHGYQVLHPVQYGEYFYRDTNSAWLLLTYIVSADSLPSTVGILYFCNQMLRHLFHDHATYCDYYPRAATSFY